MGQGAGRPSQRPRQVVLLLRPWGQDGSLGAVGPPGRADCRSQVEIPRVGAAQRRAARAWLADLTEARHPSQAAWLMVCGHQVGTLPPPADRVEPASPHRGGDRDPRAGPATSRPGGHTSRACGTHPRPEGRPCAGRAATGGAAGPAPWGAPVGAAAPGRRAPDPGSPPDRRARSARRWSARSTGPRRSPSGGVPRHTILGDGGPAGRRPARAGVPPVAGCAQPGTSRRKASWAWRGLLDTRGWGHVPCLREEPCWANLVWTHLVSKMFGNED